VEKTTDFTGFRVEEVEKPKGLTVEKMYPISMIVEKVGKQ